MEQFPIDSDFVDSYLNQVLLANTPAADDAKEFKNCVFMNPINLALTHCADRRSRVNAFIEKNQEIYDEIKLTAVEKCGKELLSTFILDKYIVGEKWSTYEEKRIVSRKFEENETNLIQCLKTHGI